MKFHAIRVHQLGCFSDVSVDLAALPQLVAVCGSNGSGKSSLLELLTSGAIWRECPTRGALPDLARARDSFVEVVVENGARYTIRQGVDAVSRKGETLILDADGAPVVASGKVADGKAWVASHFPAREVLYASTVAIQGGAGNFLGLTAGERKAVILRALGIEDIERMAEQAREQYRAAKAEHATITARIADERARGAGGIDAARVALTQAEESLSDAQAEAERRRAKLEVRSETLEAARRANAELEARRERHAACVARVTAAASEIQRIETLIQNNRGLGKDAEAIRAAAAAVAGKREAIERIDAKRRELDRKLGENEVAARLNESAADEHARWAVADANTARARTAAAAGINQLREAAAQLPACREALVEAGQAERAAAAERDASVEAQSRSAVERIKGLRGALVDIHQRTGPYGLRWAANTAGVALRDDDAREAAAIEAPERIRTATERLAACSATSRTAEAAVAAAEAAAEKLYAAEVAMEEAASADASARRRTSEEQVARARAFDIRKTMAEDRQALLTLDRERQAAADDLAATEKRARLLAPLEASESRIATLEEQLSQLRAQLDDARAEASEAEPPVGSAELDTDTLEEWLRHAKRDAEQAADAVSAATAAVAVGRARLEAAEASEQRLSALEADRARVAEQLADWSLLADSLGRDGLQAHLVDAAGPELTALANDLLHRAFGPRFTVSITTTRPKADGKGEREVFDVSVLDVERGRDGDVAGLSGGERVIVGEAISLALAMMVARRHGLERPTLVRDESGAALDPANGRRWISMLRRAVELVGADRLLFVTHSQELAEMADARLVVADGTVRVEG